MANYYWNDWYTGFGWVLWIGFIFLFISATGNWGYTYRVHRNYRDVAPGRDALDILSERYAQGEIQHQEFEKMREVILTTMNQRLVVQKDSVPARGPSFGRPIKAT